MYLRIPLRRGVSYVKAVPQLQKNKQRPSCILPKLRIFIRRARQGEAQFCRYLLEDRGCHHDCGERDGGNREVDLGPFRRYGAKRFAALHAAEIQTFCIYHPRPRLCLFAQMLPRIWTKTILVRSATPAGLRVRPGKFFKPYLCVRA